MKNLYLILTFLLISSFTIAQTTFNNGGGDKLWSNAANWTSGVPDAANAKAKIAAAEVIVDGNYTVGQMIFVSKTAGGEEVITFTTSTSGSLTITGKGVSQPVQLNRVPQHAIFNLPVIFDSSENKTETWRFNGGQHKITFGAGHSSTSISAALGMAAARDLNQSDEEIIAVIGDGAMSGGSVSLDRC